MITKINKIKNLGIFHDFKWDNDLPGFYRYNLLYGWNGTGKTTLSRLFSIIDSGVIPEEYEGCEYEFESEGNKYSTGQKSPIKIRVFNQDYVNKNVRVLEGETETIAVLGAENQEVLQKLRRNQMLLDGDPDDNTKIGLYRQLSETRGKKTNTENSRDALFTSIARTIGASVGGEALRTYTKRNSQSDFKNLATKEELTPEEFERNVSILSQQQEPEISLLSIPKTKIENIEFESFPLLDDLLIESTVLMAKTVESVSIERLRQNSDISKWVEEGLYLHKTHSSERCEFCDQMLPKDRIGELANYFSDADKSLKLDIDNLVIKLRFVYKTIQNINVPDKAYLYKDLQARYQESIADFERIKTNLLGEITRVGENLNEKKARTWEALNIETATSSRDFLASIEEINTSLTRHNQDTRELDTKRRDAQEKIKKHHLSSIYDDILSLNQKIKEFDEQIDVIRNGNQAKGVLGISQIEALIAADRGAISSTHNGCEQLNQMLKILLGRDEIIFEVKKEEDETISGYVIKRGGVKARHISDGEQTAMAFAYFCVHLTDEHFDLKEGVVVLDDPVSSLDAGMLFRVCAHIESRLVKAKQLFIFTHHYDFFNQVKQWFKNNPEINNVDLEDGEEESGRLLMTQSVYDDTKKIRAAKLTELDELLRDHESEYHYLFKRLSQFDVDNPPEDGVSLKGIYDYPNMARKLLECFLSFRCPSRGSFYVRLMDLKKINKDIPPEDLKYVYGFVNSHSHLDTKQGLIQFDITLPLSGRDSIKKTLELIKLADEKHFNAMKKMCKIV